MTTFDTSRLDDLGCPEKTIDRSTRIDYVRVADVEEKLIVWLWLNRLALGKLSLISGDPGLGKSMITCALAATVSTGGCWPDRSGNAPTGSVLMLSDEDAVADTVRPRLDAAGANLGRVYCVQMVSEFDRDGNQTKRGFSLGRDVTRLASLVEKIGDVRLITVDPVSAYLSGTDSHNNADVRGLLSPLSDLAEKYNVAVVMITHLNKGSGAAIYRSIGSIAFAAAARSAWAVTKDRDIHKRRLLLPTKNNLGDDETGLAYEIRTAANNTPVLVWEPDPVTIDINDALNSAGDSERSERDDAAQWLASELNDGPVPTTELQKRSRNAGHAWATVRRAKDSLGAIARKDGVGGTWRWWLEHGAPDDTPTPAPTLRTLSILAETVDTKGFQVAHRSQPAQDAQSERVGTLRPSECIRCDGEGCGWCQ